MAGRDRVDLAAIDALLSRLGADDDDDGHIDTVDRVDPSVPAADVRPDADRPVDGTDVVWASVAGGAASGRRRPARLRDTARPADLPPLHEPPGYRRDRRGTWRYRSSGLAVPGARDVTVRSLWPTRGTSPTVTVAVDEVDTAPELAWCATVGEPSTVCRRAGRRTVTVAAWAVPVEEWDDRADWPLTVSAPELAPGRLLDVQAAARLFAVSPSTVTADLARGRFPAPQLRVGGRPAWSLPVLLEARRERLGRW